MSEECIIKILDDFNNGAFNDSQFVVLDISENVTFFKLMSKSYSSINDMEYYYLLKEDNSDYYVGIIRHYGYEDMFFYIKDKYRGKNLLQKNLLKTILPFIWITTDISYQKLTFKEYKVYKYFIDNIGFKDDGNLKAFIDFDKIDDFVDDANSLTVNHDNINTNSLRKEINLIKKKLILLNTKFNYLSLLSSYEYVSYDKCYEDNLFELLKLLDDFDDDVIDLSIELKSKT